MAKVGEENKRPTSLGWKAPMGSCQYSIVLYCIVYLKRALNNDSPVVPHLGLAKSIYYRFSVSVVSGRNCCFNYYL